MGTVLHLRTIRLPSRGVKQSRLGGLRAFRGCLNRTLEIDTGLVYREIKPYASGVHEFCC
jgi:hypothetical protein